MFCCQAKLFFLNVYEVCRAEILVVQRGALACEEADGLRGAAPYFTIMNMMHIYIYISLSLYIYIYTYV